MANNDDYIVEILQDVGLVNRAQVERAREHMINNSVIDALVHDGTISQEDIARTLAAQNGMEFADLSQLTIMPDVVAMIEAVHSFNGRAV